MTFADMDYMREECREETKPLTKTQQLFNGYNPYRNICQGTQNRVLFVCSAWTITKPVSSSYGSFGGFKHTSCGSAS